MYNAKIPNNDRLVFRDLARGLSRTLATERMLILMIGEEDDPRIPLTIAEQRLMTEQRRRHGDERYLHFNVKGFAA